MKFKDLDICGILKKASKNSYLKSLIDDFKKDNPLIMSLRCPIKGSYHVHVPPPEKFLSILPAGEFQAIVRIKDESAKFEAIGELRYRKIY